MLGAREESAFSPRLRVAALGLLAILVAAVLAARGSAAAPSGLERAILVQEQNSARLLAREAIVGTGVGRSVSGQPDIVVLAKRDVQVPASLGGVPVELTVTGPISARPVAPQKKPGGGGGEATLGTTSFWPRPVPIGVSTGNAGECSAGTIGARVRDAEGHVYSLSNNHVYALENKATLGSRVLQPGRYDTGCVDSAKNDLGTLSKFESIVFSPTAENTVDAAIALTGEGNLGKATPAGGYGEPSSSTVPATFGLAVQKYGRTSGLTTGNVVATNGDVEVSYGAGIARFVDQVFVEGRKPFLKSGDSGSLLVTNPGANPVGLLFASGSSGKFAIANKIGAVLEKLGVTIDGK